MQHDIFGWEIKEQQGMSIINPMPVVVLDRGKMTHEEFNDFYNQLSEEWNSLHPDDELELKGSEKEFSIILPTDFWEISKFNLKNKK